MDKTLQTLDKSLSTLIEGTTEKGAKLIDWLYEQAPDVISQLLMWKGVESFVLFFIGLILVLGFPIVTLIAVKKWYNWSVAKFNCDDHPAIWMPIIFASPVIMLVTQISGWNIINLTWLKIYLAPKVYLLEYVTNNL